MASFCSVWKRNNSPHPSPHEKARSPPIWYTPDFLLLLNLSVLNGQNCYSRIMGFCTTFILKSYHTLPKVNNTLQKKQQILCRGSPLHNCSFFFFVTSNSSLKYIIYEISLTFWLLSWPLFKETPLCYGLRKFCLPRPRISLGFLIAVFPSALKNVCRKLP